MTSDDRTWVPDAGTLPSVQRPLRLAEFDDLFTTALREQQRLSPTSCGGTSTRPPRRPPGT
ncbi:hypothetical protein [Micromonospora sp. CPCC 205558]|uniref:hypothetical protein n=1 Tax=Micromonospora sp. CPCC 205558 TaxID=3122403 RepID=UPI002FEED7CB